MTLDVERCTDAIDFPIEKVLREILVSVTEATKNIRLRLLNFSLVHGKRC
jgi:hypothetical protein